MTTPTGMVMAAGAACAAALIGLAPAARADEPDPFQLLFGDSGINTWTPTADAYLATNDPTLAADFAANATHFEGQFFPDYLFGSVTFTDLTDALDPSAFTASPFLGGLPDTAIGDLAVGLDYTLFASGLGSLDAELLVLLGGLFGGL
ncbi:hypothetical protein GCM10009641_73060 [Mycobacterium cookii]